MYYPRVVYAIYPHDKKGDAAGVYVGSSVDVPARISQHKYDWYSDAQSEFHHLMRVNGFHYQELDVIEDSCESQKEYDWIDFFKRMDMKIFNTRYSTHINFDRILVDFKWQGIIPKWDDENEKVVFLKATKEQLVDIYKIIKKELEDGIYDQIIQRLRNDQIIR